VCTVIQNISSYKTFANTLNTTRIYTSATKVSAMQTTPTSPTATSKSSISSKAGTSQASTSCSPKIQSSSSSVGLNGGLIVVEKASTCANPNEPSLKPPVDGSVLKSKPRFSVENILEEKSKHRSCSPTRFLVDLVKKSAATLDQHRLFALMFNGFNSSSLSATLAPSSDKPSTTCLNASSAFAKPSINGVGGGCSSLLANNSHGTSFDLLDNGVGEHSNLLLANSGHEHHSRYTMAGQNYCWIPLAPVEDRFLDLQPPSAHQGEFDNYY